MAKILDSLKIRTKMLTLVTFTLTMILVIATVSIVYGKHLAENLEDLNDSVKPAIDAAQEIRNNLTKTKILLTEASYLVNHGKELGVQQEENDSDIEIQQEEIDRNELSILEENINLEKLTEIQEKIDQYEEENNTIYFPVIEKNVDSEQSIALLDKVKTSLSEYRESRDEAMKLALEGKDVGGQFNQAMEYSTIVDQNINELVDFADSYADFVTASSVELVNSGIVYICIFVASIIVITSLISFLIIRSLTKPINIIKSGLSQVASGDLTVEVPTHYKAEFGEMFKSFMNMVRDLNGLVLGTKATAGNISHLYYDVKSGIDKVDKSITEMDSFLKVLSTDMEGQVAGLKESSAAMDAIANGIQQIAESSTSVSELAIETSSQANNGGAVIEKSVMQMETINRVVEDTSSVVGRLVKRSKTIDAALKAITGIAEQTNLLALNASIEAARAGEHGRGFAVVADEVSKLAAQSKESANEINILLQEINEDTKEAVRAMEQGKMESKQGIEVIRQAGQAFNSIVEQVTAMTEQIQEVSATVEEISAGTEEVNSSLSEVAGSSEAVSSQAIEVVQKNNAQVEVVDKIVNVMNESKEDVEINSENLSKFKVKAEDEID